MNVPIRILEVVNVMDRAGIETMLMNHYRHIDRDVVQFDFLTHRPFQGDYDEEIRDLGGRIFQAPRLYPHNWIAYKKWMNIFFSEQHYKVVHSHIDAMSAFPLLAARQANIPVRIAHSHNDSIDKDLKYPVKQIARRFLPSVASHYWACSTDSGEFLFGYRNTHRLQVFKNALDIEGFCFDLAQRERIQGELGISRDQLVIGHIGRFEAVKNHEFLLRLFASLRKNGEDVILILVGTGALRARIEAQARRLGVSEWVHFLGLRRDIASLLQAFDIFILPSHHEGIPLVLIEAQASGLPILASSAVASDAFIVPGYAQLPLNSGLDAWITAFHDLVNTNEREKPTLPLLRQAGYDVVTNAHRLQEDYLKLWEEAK